MIVKEIVDLDYPSSISISIDDIREFFVRDDEPEDSNLCRSFNDCYSIVSLMQKAYLAGKNGEEFILERVVNET